MFDIALHILASNTACVTTVRCNILVVFKNY